MLNNESTPQPASEPKTEPEEEVLEGREGLKVGEALTAQRRLIMRIAPPEILAEIPNLDFNAPENEAGHPVFDALFMRFMDMYITKESGTNSFEDFCNFHEKDINLMKRIKEDKMTEEDLDQMYKFMVKNYEYKGLKIERPFFKDEKEVQRFLDKVLVAH